MSVSVWCTQAPGITRHEAQHALCQQRQDDHDLPPCGCTEYGGHTEKAEEPCPT